jgi:hypothetical protein
MGKVRELFNMACEYCNLVRGIDFKIDCRELHDGYKYFRYFTKYGYNDVILFRKGTGLQKFYQIGRWYSKGKGKLWQEIVRETREQQAKLEDKCHEGVVPR